MEQEEGKGGGWPTLFPLGLAQGGGETPFFLLLECSKTQRNLYQPPPGRKQNAVYARGLEAGAGRNKQGGCKAVVIYTVRSGWVDLLRGRSAEDHILLTTHIH